MGLPRPEDTTRCQEGVEEALKFKESVLRDVAIDEQRIFDEQLKRRAEQYGPRPTELVGRRPL